MSEHWQQNIDELMWAGWTTYTGFSSDSHLWVVLAGPKNATEATARFQAVLGHEPDRIYFDYGWWWMGWITKDEAKTWEGGATA